jgi:NAD kinase
MRLTCQSGTALYDSNLNNDNLTVQDFTNSSISSEPIIHAMNEVILHRGRSPHLTMLNISIDGVFLTEAIVLPPLVTLLTSRETD